MCKGLIFCDECCFLLFVNDIIILTKKGELFCANCAEERKIKETEIKLRGTLEKLGIYRCVKCEKIIFKPEIIRGVGEEVFCSRDCRRDFYSIFCMWI